MQNLQNLELENKLWSEDNIVIGVDEVGRGPLAGPIVAAAYAATPQMKNEKFKMKNEKIIVDDSKKLSARQREESNKWLIKNCFGYSLGIVGVETINKIGIGKANILAMETAVTQLIPKLNKLGRLAVLTDFFHLPNLKKHGISHQENIVGGDQRSFSIAAASIIAKVYRDNLMTSLSVKFPGYGWERNKGYGTREHLKSLKQNGKTKHHREMFIRNFV